MKEDLFISIMQKNGVSDETSIHNAYLDILHEIEKENVVKKECKSKLEKMVYKLIRDILAFRIAMNAPFFLYKNYLEKKCSQNKDIFLWQFADNLNAYAALLKSNLAGRIRIRIVDNDIKIIPTSLIKEMKRVASIGADAINNCIFDNVEYDTITGRFTVIANIIDGAFFERHGISYYFREADVRKAVFSGSLKGQKIKLGLMVNRDEIFTDFEIEMVQKSEETGISVILRDSINKANEVINGK